MQKSCPAFYFPGFDHFHEDESFIFPGLSAIAYLHFSPLSILNSIFCIGVYYYNCFWPDFYQIIEDFSFFSILRPVYFRQETR